MPIQQTPLVFDNLWIHNSRNITMSPLGPVVSFYFCCAASHVSQFSYYRCLNENPSLAELHLCVLNVMSTERNSYHLKIPTVSTLVGE